MKLNALLIVASCQAFLFSSVTANLFPFETIQLQESDVEAFPAEAAPLFAFSTPSPLKDAKCKVFPGDSKWPNDDTWAFLNSTTSNGGLIKTIPIAAPCYAGPMHNEDICNYVTNQWSNSSLHMEDPTSMMSPLYQGRTCDPPALAAHPGGNCTLGGFPSYAINASSVRDVQTAVNFARNTGIRLVVKNTGHDFSGKSGGAGALSIWTHHMKDIEFVPAFKEDGEEGYEGPAFKCGTGVQAWEIFEAANAQGLVVVGGEGRTVGVMGGYIQGGGHSPLSSIHGIAADHVLSLEVVLASGKFVTATSTQNSDVFWALRGGGGSTFGVVTSVTIKAFPDFPVTVTSFVFGGPGTNVTYDNVWAGIQAFFSHFIEFSSAGTYSYFWVIPIPGAPLFEMVPFFAPNLTVEATQALLKPWFDELAANGINISPQFTYYPDYLSAWQASFPQETVGRLTGAFGSRLFPRENWEDETSFNATFNAWKDSIDAGLMTISFNYAPTSAAGGHANNSVNPAWRKTVLHTIQLVSWANNDTDATIRAQLALLEDRQAAWKAVSPGAGSYLGESDRNEVGFQQSFYGDFYARLLGIKRDVDPEQVFWAKTGVGSEGWDVDTRDVLNDENGRLCRVVSA